MLTLICPNCDTENLIHPATATRKNAKLFCIKCKILLQLKESMHKNESGQKEAELETKVTNYGCLIVRDEVTLSQSYNLKLGKQIIGRKSVQFPSDFEIETNDLQMSRNHFSITIELNKKNSFDYILKDNSSTNYTFINAETLQQLKKEDEFLLQDGDIIQAGITKIVFKIGNLKIEEGNVKNSPIGKTVILN